MTVRNQDSSTSTSTPRARLQGMGLDTWTWTTAHHPKPATHRNQTPSERTNAMNANTSSRAMTARLLVTHPPERR
jgi:hypothetical protein